MANLADLGARMRVPAGQFLYRAGDPREAIFLLQSGFAQVVAGATGCEHVVRFLIPGDLAVLDAFAGGRHANEVRCLEDCEVCSIPTARLAGARGAREGLLRSLLARELAATEEHAAMLSRLDARQRVANFLLDLSRRWAERGFPQHRFGLAMGRRAIGQHLALTMETVSRVLSDFQACGWIALRWREVALLDPEALRCLVPCSAHSRKTPSPDLGALAGAE